MRAVVADPAHRTGFDAWYRDDHMAKVRRVFSPLRAWRSWSTLDPSVHYANYEFDALENVHSMMATPAFRDLVNDFSQRWDGKVKRTRDVVVTVDPADE